MNIKNMNKFTRNIVFAVIVFILTISAVDASSTFTLSVATEHGELSTLGNPHYLSSVIRVTSYTPDGMNVNFGPNVRQVQVTDSSDDFEAYVDFWPIPTDSIVQFLSTAEGFENKYGETYVSSKLSDAYESLEQNFHDISNGFTTTCSLSIENNIPYYLCSVVDGQGISGQFYYIRPEDPNTGEIYDLVYVTNKLYPLSVNDDNGDDSDNDNGNDNDNDNGDDAPIVCTDNDGDGYAIEGGHCGPIDCDDNDPTVYPGAPEVCNGKDNNCNGLIDGVSEEGDMCIASPSSGPLKTLNVMLSPNVPTEDDNLVCRINVRNAEEYTGNNNIQVYYEVSTTKGFNVRGDFLCPQGNCEQEIFINSRFTEKDSNLVCDVWFDYNSRRYQKHSSVNINPSPRGQTLASDEKYNLDLNGLRFFGGDMTRPGGSLEFRLTLNNQGKPISDLKVNVGLLGLYTGQRYNLGPFDLDYGDSEVGRVMIEIPDDVEPGQYHARISLTDGSFRMVRHRTFIIRE